MKPLAIRTRLRLVALATAVPLLAFAAGLVLWHGNTEQALLREQAARSATAAMQGVDREVAAGIAGLQVLAASPALASGDFRGFHAQASRAVGIAGSRMVALYARDGTRVVSTAVPSGQPMPRRSDMSDIGVPFQTGRPHVSSLFISASMHAPTLAIVVPVILDGQVRYVLAAGVLSERLSHILAIAGTPHDWTVSLLDQQGTIIGRTTNAQAAVGRKAQPSNWQRVQSANTANGTFDGVTQEGEHVFLSYARSGTSGWTTVVGIPASALQGELRRSLAVVAAAGILALALAYLLGWWAAKHIYGPLWQLERAARRLHAGQVIDTPPTGIEQFDRVAQAMDEAGRTLREREAHITHNLDELRMAHEMLREAHEQLRGEQVKKDEFIATLAHELRNPLAPLRTGVHVLAKSPPAAVAARTLATMERQLTHMVRLIDDLLDVSRIARGKLVLDKQPVILQDLISHAVDASAPLLQAAGHRFELHVPPEPIRLEADPTRISQVITNLLNNAAKFTPAGGLITLSARRHGRRAEVRITDTGIGIEPARLREVFELFHQVKEEAHSGPPGLGIGLSLAQMLVELHGGSIDASSEGRGHGSTFTIRLPLGRPQAAGAVEDDRSGAPHEAGLAVLLVEDNADAAEVLATALRLAGHAVFVGHDGPGALALAQQHAADVVLLDIGLPGMNGYEVCRMLRRQPAYADAKIVALTGWGAPADRERARQAGFDAHLTKPVDWVRLEEVLDRGYDRHLTGERQ